MEAAAAHQQKEKDPYVHRPCAFDKMEGLVREMQDPENGVPVRSQKQFLTSIPSAFMGECRRYLRRGVSVTGQQSQDTTGCLRVAGYDLVEWLMERLAIEESEAVHIANQLCQYGYFFPVNDSKTLTVKDDSSLYRFQTPYYWPWQHRTPDNVEYAIYLAKRTRRNKQRHALEDYEIEALNSLRRNLQNKWDLIQQQAEEQVRLSKERKKGDKIVSDSQERAFWRVYRPPPGCLSSLEVVPVPTRGRPGAPRPPPRKRTLADLQREVELLRNSLTRTRIKMSTAIENLKNHFETYTEYDPMIVQPQPSNPWITDDQIFWQLNSPLVEVPTEKRVKRWALSMEEVMSDPTGLLEFTNYLRKEYSHENIRFWMAVKDLRRSFQAQIPVKVNEIYEEFLAAGAPCEINIDGKTMEKVQQEMKNPTRFTFDAAAEHVYTLLLKKDCYPRFIRSEHYRQLLAAGVQPLQKKRFFGFGGQAKKKASSTSVPTSGSLQQHQQQQTSGGGAAGTGRRRGSDRSLSGSAHELAICGIRDIATAPRVPHSHSQSNLTDIPYRGDLACLVKIPARPNPDDFQDAGVSGSAAVVRPTDDVCPWDAAPGPVPGPSSERPGDPGGGSSASVGTAAGGGEALTEARGASRKNSSQFDSGSSSSDVSVAVAEAAERLRRSCTLQQQQQQQQQQQVAGCPRGSRGASVTFADTSRASVSSSNEYFSPQRSFDLSHSAAAPQLEETTDTPIGVVDTSEGSISPRGGVPAMAPVISISSIVGEILAEETQGAVNIDCKDIREENSTVEDDVVVEDDREDREDREEGNESRNNAATPHVRIEIDGEELAEDAQVVPVWEPDTQTQESTRAIPTPMEQQDNNDNEVCPWEDEENCRVDATYVKTYSTLGYL
ncbi:regulator of G-protein signaling 9 isoform X2 [Neodiprion pinetum]|uniref:regulator of G-protein signaling 9 isoform X2 n=1 Tax=Neodiprion pinetum TaxID=441929 RepID=UPI001EE033EA|nr:regulator of G-protein signaling 9 isoform X2 [Neodiprion pinetum]